MHPSSSLPPCDRFAPLLEAWLDGELADSAEAKALERHLQDCPACYEESRALAGLGEALRSLPAEPAPPALREAVRSRLLPPGFRSLRQESLLRYMNHPGLALAAAVFAGLVIGFVLKLDAARRLAELPPPSRPAAAPLVDEHISLVMVDDGSSLQTRDPEALETWFSQRLDFSPLIPVWPWAELLGGRVCVVSGNRVARVQYRAAEREFTLFIQFVGESLDAGLRACNSGRRASISQHRGYKAALWSNEGFTYVLVAQQSAKPIFENLKKSP